jgi:hypothetical protein
MGRRSDLYTIFTKRLQEGDPPDNWDALPLEAESADPKVDLALCKVRKKNRWCRAWPASS